MENGSRLSVVIAYYDNPLMLRRQYEVFANLPQTIKANLSLVLVDDGSPRVAAADVPRDGVDFSLVIYRVLFDRRWNQHAARNIGAHEAKSEWLLLTDIDHLIPESTLQFVMWNLEEKAVFTFSRKNAQNLTPNHPHPNSFLIKKELYWEIGGYDEDFCGMYGTDAFFLQRMRARARVTHLPDAPLLRVPREMIEDASTTTYSRQQTLSLRLRRKAIQLAKRSGLMRGVQTLTCPYERVL